jgi:acyl dehydratase
MAFDPAALLALDIPEHVFRYEERDTMLYALGIGLGDDPLDRRELPFVYERDLKVVPTMAAIIGWDRSWIGRTGIDWVKVVHGEERLTLHRPLAPAAELTIRARIVEVIDKGKDKGAIFVMETVGQNLNGAAIFTRSSSFFARGDGGFGGPRESKWRPHVIPDRDPDAVVTYRTHPNQALIYRLSGDRNPLHCDPNVAAAAGFKQPILHGLCSYGYACRGVLAALCNYDTDRIAAFDVRFTSPVLPGATLRIEMWRDGGIVSFRALEGSQGTIVLNNGRAEFRS